MIVSINFSAHIAYVKAKWMKYEPFSDSVLGSLSDRVDGGGGGGRIFGTIGAATALARFCFGAPRSLFGCPGFFRTLRSTDRSLLLDPSFTPFPLPFWSSMPSSDEESISDSESIMFKNVVKSRSRDSVLVVIIDYMKEKQWEYLAALTFVSFVLYVYYFLVLILDPC